jgi:hypothetical protein
MYTPLKSSIRRILKDFEDSNQLDISDIAGFRSRPLPGLWLKYPDSGSLKHNDDTPRVKFPLSPECG